jgi:hypothetical protein
MFVVEGLVMRRDIVKSGGILRMFVVADLVMVVAHWYAGVITLHLAVQTALSRGHAMQQRQSVPLRVTFTAQLLQLSARRE